MAVPEPGLYWEDIRLGMDAVSPGRTVTEADVVAFAGLSGDFNPIHTDAEHSAEHALTGQRVAHGLLGLSIASGLFTRCALGASIQANVLALLGLEWSFTGPIHLGDTIHLQFEVVGRRETSKPDRGIVKLARRLHLHDQVVVQEGTTTLMLGRRP